MPRSTRPQKVADLIQRALAELLQHGARDPRFAAVTITAVDVSSDLANAKIFISLLDETKIPETLKALNNAAGYLRHELADAVELRITPKLLFVYDESISHGDKLARLIKDAPLADKNKE